MGKKWNIRIGLLALLLVLCIAVGSLNFVVFAEETEGAEPDQTVDETIPEEHIFLQWDVDSSLTYRVDEDNYVWVVYDANGKALTNGNGVPASAGYELTGCGDWFGSAEVTLTITNNLPNVVKLKLLFMNDLSSAALEISSTLQTEDANVDYDPESGELIMQPNAEGVVTLTISAEVLQNAQATIDEDNTVAGWIRVQVLSIEPEETQAESGSGTSTESTEESTEESSEDTSEQSAADPSEDAAEDIPPATTEETVVETTAHIPEETIAIVTDETVGETTSEDQAVG